MLRSNNFNLLRMLAAMAVIVSHSFPLALGDNDNEPLTNLTGFSLGGGAVRAFFAISGYFILLSFERRSSNIDFVVARSLRLFPALIVVGLVTAFGIGLWLTTSGAYLVDWRVWAYPVRVTTIIQPTSELPGLFESNPYPQAVNGSLWTLYYEVCCYLGLFIAGIFGLLTKRRFPIVVLCFVAFDLMSNSPYAFLGFPFLIGMAVYLYGLNGLLVLTLLCVSFVSTALGNPSELLWSAFIATGTLWLGFTNIAGINAYNRVGDYSYGTYIYAFPVQQSIIFLAPGLSPYGLMLFAIPATIVCGVGSWYLVERWPLTLRKRISEVLGKYKRSAVRTRS